MLVSTQPDSFYALAEARAGIEATLRREGVMAGIIYKMGMHRGPVSLSNLPRGAVRRCRLTSG